jgi:hypothetical protein
VQPPDVVGYAYQLYATAGWTSLPWLHRVGAPTLIGAGDDDPSVPVANARTLAARLANARINVLTGGGHLFLLDEPQKAIDPILSFLDEQPKRAMPDYGHDLRLGAFLTPQSRRPQDVVALAQLSQLSGLGLVTFQDLPYQPTLLDTWTLLSYVGRRPIASTSRRTS